MQFLVTHITEALGKQVSAKLLLRGTRDGFAGEKFQQLCYNQGPLLVLFMTGKDILCGGFTSISWKDTNDKFVIDPKCFIFSLKSMKIYKR